MATRQFTYEFRSEGAEQLKRELDDLARAAEAKVVAATEGNERERQSAERLQSELEKLEKRYDRKGEANKRAAADQRALNELLAAGAVSTTRYSEIMNLMLQRQQVALGANSAYVAALRGVSAAAAVAQQGNAAFAAAMTGVSQAATAATAQTGRFAEFAGGLRGVVGAGTEMAGMFALARGTLVGFVAALGVDQVISFVRGVNQAVGGLADLATQIGVNVTALQAYQLAAAQGGVAQKDMETGLATLVRRMGEAKMGSEQTVAAFEAVGVKLLDSAGKMRAPEAVLAEVAEGLLALPDAASRAAAAVDIFGKTGQRLLPILASLASGQNEMIAKARQLGVVIDESVIRQLNEVTNQSVQAELKWRALTATLIAPLEIEAIKTFGAALGWLQEQMRGVKVTWADVAQFIASPGAKIGGFVAGRIDPMADLQAKIAAAEKRISELQPGAAVREGTMPTPGWRGPLQRPEDSIAQREARLAEENRKLAELNAEYAKLAAQREEARRFVDGQGGSTGSLPSTGGAANPTKPGGGGGGGGGGRDPQAAYAAAKKAVDEYVESLTRESEQLRMSERDKAIAIEVTRAEELAQRALNEAKKAGIDLGPDYIESVKQQAAAGAAARYDQQQASRAAEAEQQRFQRLYEQREKKFWDGIQGIWADAFMSLTDTQGGGLKNIATSASNFFRQYLSQQFSQGMTGLMQGAYGSAAGAGGGAGAGGAPGGMAGLGSLFSGASSMFSGLFGGGASAAGTTGAMAAQQSVAAMGGTMSGTAGAAGASGAAGAASAIPVWGWIAAIAIMAKNMLGPSGPGIRGGLSTMLGPSIEEWMADPKAAAGNVFNPLGGVFASGLGNMLGMDWLSTGFGLFPGNKPPRTPQATQDIVIDPATGRAIRGGTTTRGQGNIPGVEEGGSFVTDAINRTMHGIGLRFGSTALGGYLLNSQGNNTGDQWIVGSGTYEGGSELADGLDGQEAASRLIGEIIRRAAADNAVIETGRLAVTATMRAVLSAAGEVDSEELSGRIDFARQYDEFLRGDGVAAGIENAVLSIRESVNAMVYEAERLGVATAPLDTEMGNRLRAMYDQFADPLSDELLGRADPRALANLQNDRWRDDQLAAVQAWLDETVISTAEAEAKRLEIIELYGKRQADITEQFAAGAVSGLQDLYRRLTYGDLSGASPTRALEGAQASFGESFNAALDGGATAQEMQAFLAASEQYGRLALQTHGIGGDFAAINAAVTAAVAAVNRQQGGTLPAVGGAVAIANTSDDGTIRSLVDNVKDLLDELRLLRSAIPQAA